MTEFKLKSDFAPKGSQRAVIGKLIPGVSEIFQKTGNKTDRFATSCHRVIQRKEVFQ